MYNQHTSDSLYVWDELLSGVLLSEVLFVGGRGERLDVVLSQRCRCMVIGLSWNRFLTFFLFLLLFSSTFNSAKLTLTTPHDN